MQVVDLASGERIPEEILAALTDERVTKWAFNANFERVCLSRYLGMPNDEFLDPAQWRCTMIWSAYLGLPLSLMGVGAALALDKKTLSEGKELIRYFCPALRCHQSKRWAHTQPAAGRAGEMDAVQSV